MIFVNCNVVNWIRKVRFSGLKSVFLLISMRLVLVGILLLAGGITAHAQYFLWSDSLTAAQNQNGTAVAVDNFSRTIVAGTFENNITFPYTPTDTTLVNSGGIDSYLARYDQQGNILWVRQVGSSVGSGNDIIHDVAVDNEGNIYAVGETSSPTAFFQGGSGTVSTADTAMFVVKYDSLGNVLWVEGSTGLGMESATSVAFADGPTVDFLVLAGIYKNLFTYSSTSLPVEGSTVKTFFLSIDPGTGGFTTTSHRIERMTGTDSIVVTDIDLRTIGIAGYAYLCGYSNNCTTIGYFGNMSTGASNTIPTSGGKDAWTCLITLANGNCNWIETITDNNDEIANAIKYDNDKIYITGFYEDSVMNIADTLISSGQKDIFVSVHDVSGTGGGAGTPIGVTGFGGPGNDEGHGIGIDQFNNIYVGGFFNGTVAFSPDTVLTTASANPDGFLAKFHPNGNAYWATSFPNNGSSTVTDVDVNATRLGLTGDFASGNLSIPTFPAFTSNAIGGGSDAFVAYFENICTDTTIYNNSISGNQNLCVGEAPATITGLPALGGNGAYAYQWVRSHDGVLWEKIPGATTQNYTPIVLGDDMLYRRVVESGCNWPDSSNTVTLTVDQAVPNWTQPAVICSNDPPLDLNSLLDPIETGTADGVVANTGATAPGAIVGAENGAGATLPTSGNDILVDLTDTIPAGQTYTIVWRQTPGTTGASSLSINEGVMTNPPSTNSVAPFTEIESYHHYVMVAEVPTRYIRLTSTGNSIDLDAITYSIGSTTGGTWSQVGSLSIAGSTLNTTGVGTGNITYTVTSGVCTQDSTINSVVVNGAAVGGTLGIVTEEFCAFPTATNAVELDITGQNGSIQWQFSTNGGTVWNNFGLGGTGQDTTAFGPTLYRAELDIAGCSVSFSDTVGVFLDTTSPGIICPTDITTDIDPGFCTEAVSFTFASGDTTDNCSIASFTQTAGLASGAAFPLGTTTNTFEVQDVLGNTNTCSFTVTVADDEDPVVTSCPSNMISCDSVFTWIAPTATDCSPLTITNTSSFMPGDTFPFATTTITYTITDTALNTSTCTFDVHVLPFINTTFVLPDTVCLPSGLVDLSASTVLDTGQTSVFQGSAGAVITGTDFDPTTSTPGAYTISHIIDNGFCMDTLILPVDVLPEFNAQWTNPDTVCAVDNIVDLNPWLDAGVTPGGYWFGNSVVDDTTWNVNALDGTFPLSHTAGIGQCADTVTQDVYVGGLVDPSWVLTDTSCSNEVLDLSTMVTGTAGGTFTGTGVTGSSFDPNSLLEGDYFITYSVGVPFCAETLTDSIFIREAPIAIAGADTGVCDSVLTLNAFSSGGLTSLWTWPVEIEILDDTDPMADAKALMEGQYKLYWTVTNQNCQAVDSITIDYFYPPTVVFAGNDTTIDFLSSFQLNASVPDYGTGEWSAYGAQTFNDPSLANATVSDLEGGENILVWIVTNGVCPVLKDSIIITLNQLVLPSGFSPNGDGTNDLFVIGGLPVDLNPELIVFNRWGNVVYESIGYKNDWGGLSNSGKELIEDTYFYVLKIEGAEAQSGYLIIQR